jgi:hypothetical protein
VAALRWLVRRGLVRECLHHESLVYALRSHGPRRFLRASQCGGGSARGKK